jgi:hypothetical protein
MFGPKYGDPRRKGVSTVSKPISKRRHEGFSAHMLSFFPTKLTLLSPKVPWSRSGATRRGTCESARSGEPAETS